MKSRLLLAVVFGLSQALVLTGAVTAQGGEPPTPPPGVSIIQPAHARSQANMPGSATTVPLGQPGLSFRYVRTFGVTDQPYPTDVQHLNRPIGLFVDTGDNLYTLEDAGRVLKFNSSGSNLLSIGTPGLEFRADYVFAYPEDVAVDGGGSIWVVDNNRAAEYSSSGTHLQDFPSADPWASGSDNGHFNSPTGIAFDSGGRMYVSDGSNQRIQVFSFSGSTPVYSTTIGVTGVTGSDDSHFNRPAHIAIDGSDRLYVVDQNNHRVERCAFSAGWTCVTYVGVSGISGIDPAHLNSPYGITTGPGNTIYIADGGNNRVLKCDAAPTCTAFAGIAGVPGSDNSHFQYAQDVALDSAGNVYVADVDNFRVQKFNSLGQYQTTLGVTGVPYVTDSVRFNTPAGVAVRGDGSVYFTEDRGHRAIKLDASGAEQWTYGVAGVYQPEGDNVHLGTFWGGTQGNPALDAAGHLYVPDAPNGRIQILDTNGHYLTTFGSPGQGDNQFSGPTSVFIRPSNGDIYVADQWNHRIQVFDSNRIHKATLGVTGVSGTAGQHFTYPWGVTVDANGTVYVADSGNNRIQKCNVNGSGGTCITFAGETGVQGYDFGHFGWVVSVATDGAGRVYALDAGNQRVQVYDSSSAYLATIGGSYGSGTGQMRNPAGVAVDNAGNVYVTDRADARIQEFAPGVMGWRQTNLTGFGSPNVAIPSLAVMNGQLYAGTADYTDHVFHVWRTTDGRTWQQAGAADLGGGIPSLISFNNNFYAGTWTPDVWRSPDALSWTRVITGGFLGNNASGVARFSIFSGLLYASTYNSQIWRTSNGTDWNQFGTTGLGDPSTCCVVASEIFGGHLYFGLQDDASGAQLWRTNGLTVTAIMTGGFGSATNQAITALDSFGGDLYAAVVNNAGVQVWRSPDGTNWSRVATDGLGNPNNNQQSALEVLNDQLYLVLGNNLDGAEVWRSPDGTTWTQVGPAGFGSSNNSIPEKDSSVAVFQGRLFMGVNGWGTGGQVWQLLNQLYLPLVRR